MKPFFILLSELSYRIVSFSLLTCTTVAYEPVRIICTSASYRQLCVRRRRSPSSGNRQCVAHRGGLSAGTWGHPVAPPHCCYHRISSSKTDAFAHCCYWCHRSRRNRHRCRPCCRWHPICASNSPCAPIQSHNPSIDGHRRPHYRIWPFAPANGDSCWFGPMAAPGGSPLDAKSRADAWCTTISGICTVARSMAFRIDRFWSKQRSAHKSADRSPSSVKWKVNERKWLEKFYI